MTVTAVRDVTPTDITAAVKALRAGGADAVVAAARQAASVLATTADDLDRTGEFPAANLRLLWAAGLGALTIPAADGGVGASLTTTAQAIEILAAADAATTLILVWQLSHHLFMRLQDWPQPWVDRITADALTGPGLINGLGVEPDLGSQSRGGVPATTAVRGPAPDGSPGWRISGHKSYCTGSHGLQWLAVLGATAADDPDGVQIGLFLVPGDAPGVEIRETWEHLGMRATASHDILLHDVAIPLDAAIGLGPVGGPPLAGTTDSLGPLLVLIYSLYNGIAKASRDWLVDYLNRRIPTNLGAPLTTLPRFQEAGGEIEALLYTNDRLLTDLAT